jgi:hypothetical protein
MALGRSPATLWDEKAKAWEFTGTRPIGRSRRRQEVRAKAEKPLLPILKKLAA